MFTALQGMKPDGVASVLRAQYASDVRNDKRRKWNGLPEILWMRRGSNLPAPQARNLYSPQTECYKAPFRSDIVGICRPDGA